MLAPVIARGIVVGSVLLAVGGMPAIADTASPGATDPKVGVEAKAKAKVKAVPKPVAMTPMKLELPNRIGVPGETVILKATLRKSDGTPVHNEPVRFRLQGNGKMLDWGESHTQANGTALNWIKVPRYPQAGYELVAEYAGNKDKNFQAVKVTSKFAIFKVMVKIGAKLDVQGSSPDYRWWTIEVRQFTNGEQINSWVTATIGTEDPRRVLTGQPLIVGKKGEPYKTRQVTVQFDGNEWAIANKVTFNVP